MPALSALPSVHPAHESPGCGPSPAPAVAAPPARVAVRCPLCGGTRFDPVNGRSQARCAHCLSMERTRLLFLLLLKLNPFRPGMKILHLAPEAGLRVQLYKAFGEDYHAADFSPELYGDRLSPIFPLDLTRDLQRFPSRVFDVILHNHVLEHLPVPLEAVFHHLQRILKPGGWHFFTLPIVPGPTLEDIHETDPARRLARFRQHDHFRIFGTDDTLDLLRAWTGVPDPRIPVAHYLTPEEVAAAAIPHDEAFAPLTSSTPFLLRK